jgi:DNA polymerase-4
VSVNDWRRVYAHLDMDAFYVSVELARRPELAGLPVVVSGTGPRAVVTTASYEARRFGVGSAMPAARARRLCPDAVFVAPDFTAYRSASREVMAVLAEHVDTVEVVGLDEAYLDLTGLSSPRAAARRIQGAVRERTGLGCSIGIGPSKLVAKVASDAEKPGGFVVLSQAEARRRFATAPPGLVPGIGPKTEARLAAEGITTLGALADAPEARLVERFGPRLGRWLGHLARFEDERPLQTVRRAKSESRETTFPRDISGWDVLASEIGSLAEQLCATLARHGRTGRTIGIKVRLDDFSTHTRARTLPAATNDLAAVREVALDLLRAFDAPRPVRLLGVRVAGLDSEHPDPEGGESEQPHGDGSAAEEATGTAPQLSLEPGR